MAKESNLKGWRSDNPSRCGATHYVSESMSGTLQRSECGRALLWLIDGSFAFKALPPLRRKRFRELGVCDPCQTVRATRRHRARIEARRASHHHNPGKIKARKRK